jgi:LmbE family N-acetylglucosaminyl deacetylase
MTKDNILILSPHTDDAELGCGGTIAKLIEEGKNILWVAFSTAEESLPPGFPKNTLVQEFNNVTESLGLHKNNVIVYDFEVRKLTERRQDVLEELIRIRKDFHPDIVLGPSLNDHHQDHHVVSHEMIRAYKSEASIICYELPWNHIEFKTQMFVKLREEHIKKKLEMLSYYKSQFHIKRPYLTEDFIKGLAYTRGAQIGQKYAEAFEVIRWIE